MRTKKIVELDITLIGTSKNVQTTIQNTNFNCSENLNTIH